MPFVQRVVKPEFVSRSSYGGGKRIGGLVVLQKGGNDGTITTINQQNTTTTTTTTSTSGTGCCINSLTTTGTDTTARSDNDASSTIINGRELDLVTNTTLSNALRQMASVVIIANDIFLDLNLELQKICNKTKSIKQRIHILEENVNKYNPKEIEVPESDFETFLLIKNHFKSKLICDKELFVKTTRPRNVQNLYEAAGKTPEEYDCVDAREYNNITTTTNKYMSNTTTTTTTDEITTFLSNSNPFVEKKHKLCSEIETRLPAELVNLRKWTSAEALGELTVTPDCISKIGSFVDTETEIPSVYPSTYTKFTDSVGLGGDNNDHPIDHRLPSPEEQSQIIAKKYPAEVISVDITGRQFERMCLARKSIRALENAQTDNTTTITTTNTNDTEQRKSRTKKSRGKRRNTIIGIDPKEISEAAEGENVPCKSSNDLSTIESISERSKSSDLFRKETTASESSCKSTLSRLNSLKNWGRNRLKLVQSSDDKKKRSANLQEADCEIDDYRIHTTIIKSKKKFFDKGKHYFSPEPKNNDKNFTLNYLKSNSSSNSPESITNLNNNNNNNPSSSSSPSVKLRESSSLRRQRRNDSNPKDDPPHSSSGNWSASSESGRASIGSEITILPKSSASSISLNHNNSYHSFGTGPPSSVISRRRFLNTSASSSVTSEGPSTPDPQMNNDISFIDDETSSSYSCDTEGYYTSFHIDSGLKTLREEEPVTPLHSTSALSSNNSIGTLLNQTGDNEYELFGRGSTSTTASSAGTVCTTLILSNENDLNSIQYSEVNENKLSYSSSNCSSSTAVSTLERCATIKRNSKIFQQPKELIEVTVHLENCEKNETAGILQNKNNTAIEEHERSEAAANKYELDCAEYSDVESSDRSERIRQKTAISSSRIPSMCIITPTTSDDENTKGIVPAKINRDVQYPVPIDQDSIQEHIVKVATSELLCEQEKSENKQIIKLEGNQTEIDEISNMSSNDENLYDNVMSTSMNKLKDIIDDEDSLDIEISMDKNIYHTIGEYVTLADIGNNKHKNNTKIGNTGTSLYFPNRRHNHATDVLPNQNTPIGEENILSNKEIEYVSLKELPCYLTKNNKLKTFPFSSATIDQNNLMRKKINNNCNTKELALPTILDNEENKNIPPVDDTVDTYIDGMRVAFNAHGNIIYNSDSLRRQKKRGHSTFLPGPHVKVVADNTSSILTSSGNRNTDEEDCYVELIDNKKFLNKLMSGGGLINHRVIQKNIQPISVQGKMENSNIVVAKQQYQEEHKDNKDFANEEMQQHRDFQNLLHQKHEPFKRNAQIYGTLPRKEMVNQNLRISSAASKLASNAIYKSPKNQIISTSNMSPIVPCNKGSFRTSTPSKLAEHSISASNLPAAPPAKNIDLKAKQNIETNFKDVPKVCSDRMGTAKTSLMDFKKLLLAKSTKNVTTNHKLSAVEMLKVAKENALKGGKASKCDATSINNVKNQPKSQTTSSLSTSMLLLDLSRSPRSFASRRMIRQGQFGGSPSKYNMVVNKKRSFGMGNTIGTDVMSTTILEANKEEDSASSSSSIGSQKSMERQIDKKSISDEHIDLRSNFFLQAEENNFMKSEIDNSKYRFHLTKYRQELALKNKLMNTNNIIGQPVPLPSSLEQNNLSSASSTSTIMATKPPSYETSL